jgi:hypothetical protein
MHLSPNLWFVHLVYNFIVVNELYNQKFDPPPLR